MNNQPQDTAPSEVEFSMGDQRHRDVDPIANPEREQNIPLALESPLTGGNLPERGILLEAHEIVGGDRQNDYGTPEQNWGRISRIASAMCETDLSPEVCVKVLLACKMARMITSPKKRDNYVDLAGYAHVLWQVVK